MILYPAIDLKSGKCVRLWKGDFNQTTQYSDHSIEMAQAFAQAGATWLHIVDLDGAQQGKPLQKDLILSIKKASGIQIQTGGGIRTLQDVQNLLDHGIERVVIGSIAIDQPETVLAWLEQLGSEKIVIALDIQIQKDIPLLASHGWQTVSSKNLWDLLDFYRQHSNLQHILCTDIQLDGTLQGPNLPFYSSCKARYPGLSIQASGGISCLEDIRELKQAGLAGTIIGKALYEKQFSFLDAIKCVEEEVY